MAAFLLAVVLFVGLCTCLALFLKWNEIMYSKKGMPPGTIGWPLFGETTAFLRDGPDFMKNHSARHGSFCKSHILGSPTVICMDFEINRYILLNEAKGLVPGYPQSTVDILEKTNIAAAQGSTHECIRRSMLSLVGPTAIKDQLLPKIDKSI